MKYKRSIAYYSKAMAIVKVFADKQTGRRMNGQTDGPKTVCLPSIDAGAQKGGLCTSAKGIGSGQLPDLSRYCLLLVYFFVISKYYSTL